MCGIYAYVELEGLIMISLSKLMDLFREDTMTQDAVLSETISTRLFSVQIGSAIYLYYHSSIEQSLLRSPRELPSVMNA